MKAIKILRNFEVTCNGKKAIFQKDTFIDRYEIRQLLHLNKTTPMGYWTIVSIIPDKDAKTFENLMILADKCQGYDYIVMSIVK